MKTDVMLRQKESNETVYSLTFYLRAPCGEFYLWSQTVRCNSHTEKSDPNVINLLKANVIPQITALHRHSALQETLVFPVFPPDHPLAATHILKFQDLEGMDSLLDELVTK